LQKEESIAKICAIGRLSWPFDSLCAAGSKDCCMRSPLAESIRDARLTVRLTQHELATRLGLNGRAVYRWEGDVSAPRRHHRHALVTAIRALDPNAASKLQAAFEGYDSKTKRIVPALPPPAPTPAPPTGEVALELAIFAMADELDLAPRRLRASLARLFARLAEAGFSLDSARKHVEARLAGSQQAAG
jgi:DNA-binding transcriptional regulator YiaG